MTSLAPLCTPDTLRWFLKAGFGHGLGISASGSNTRNRAKPPLRESEQTDSPQEQSKWSLQVHKSCLAMPSVDWAEAACLRVGDGPGALFKSSMFSFI